MDNRFDLSQMASELASVLESGSTKQLPLEQWSPSDCGFLPLLIDHEGQWWSTDDIDNPSPYRRPKLVKLLSQLLWCEPGDIKPGSKGNYSLRTPHESVKIVVEDVPFIVVDYKWSDDKTEIICTTQVGEQFSIGEKHPIMCSTQAPYSLRTPHESVKIVVEDVPFIVVDYKWSDDKTEIICTTQVGEQFSIGEKHPIMCSTQAPFLPYALVRRNLWARFNRNSYYRLVNELLSQNNTEATSTLSVTSQGKTFVIAGDIHE